MQYIVNMNLELPMRLLDWIHPDKINWSFLCYNQSKHAIQLLEIIIPDKIYWNFLSTNPSAIHLLEKYPDKIFWDELSYNRKKRTK